jgi:peptide/nickel transport system permease protein
MSADRNREFLPVGGLGGARQVPARRLSSGWTGSRSDQFAIFLLLFMTGLTFLAPVLAPHNPDLPIGSPLMPPSHAALFGTDQVGRDLLSRVLYGMRTSWLSGLALVVVVAMLGSMVGLVAGMSGGLLDTILMRLTDLFLSLPGFMVAIVVVVALGPSLLHELIGVGIVDWPSYARTVRAEIRALAARPHYEAARMSDISRVRLAMRHLLPGARGIILVTATLDLGSIIVTLASLSFLGLGTPQPAPELGSMTAQGLPYLLTNWWVAIFPALAVFLLSLIAFLAGDGMQNLLSDRT